MDRSFPGSSPDDRMRMDVTHSVRRRRSGGRAWSQRDEIQSCFGDGELFSPILIRDKPLLLLLYSLLQNCSGDTQPPNVRGPSLIPARYTGGVYDDGGARDIAGRNRGCRCRWCSPSDRAAQHRAR